MKMGTKRIRQRDFSILDHKSFALQVSALQEEQYGPAFYKVYILLLCEKQETTIGHISTAIGGCFLKCTIFLFICLI